VKKVAAPVLNEDESSSEDDSDVHEDILLLREMTDPWGAEKWRTDLEKLECYKAG